MLINSLKLLPPQMSCNLPICPPPRSYEVLFPGKPIVFLRRSRRSVPSLRECVPGFVSGYSAIFLAYYTHLSPRPTIGLHSKVVAPWPEGFLFCPLCMLSIFLQMADDCFFLTHQYRTFWFPSPWWKGSLGAFHQMVFSLPYTGPLPVYPGTLICICLELISFRQSLQCPFQYF